MSQNISHLSKVAAGIALAITLVVVFVLCAIAQAIFPFISAAHMWINLFTAAPIGSLNAWIEGILSSVVFGFVAGYIFALVYNTVAGQKN